VLVLEDDAGIGNTTVWRDVVPRAEERSFRVLSCRPAGRDGSASPPLGDVIRLLPTTVHLVVAGKGEIDISTGGTVTTTSYGPLSSSGNDTWAGTLVVPGLDFDLTPPVLTGANSKTVRVPRRPKHVRIAHTVTARDDVDGTRPVSCRPRSRGWFAVGRTRVRCSATDTSGNVGTVTFVLTVKRRQ
jgi:hypothetical protein